jgi:hypothetical protein
MFPIVGFLACQILGIVRSQTKTETIFSLTCILTNLRRCHLQSKNWSSDPRDGCKLFSNLVELIQTYLGFEKELEEFEGSFEQDEIVDI